MSTTLTNLLYHIVFSTKYRRQLITPNMEDDLYRYLGGILNDIHGILLEIGGMPNHVHLLAKLSPTIAVADALRLLKCNSSKWVNERGTLSCRFGWQAGYGAFSVSESQFPSVREYIRNQKLHHQRLTFKQEFKELLVRHHIEFDERYLWDEERII